MIVQWFLTIGVACLISSYFSSDFILLVFLANVNSRSRSLYAISRPSVVCLSVVCLSVCDVGAPYSGG